MTASLFQPATLAGLPLRNRIVMAPMTRNRALGNIPNDLMATYYTQRATAGLIITEGTTPSPNGLGYPRIPGLFSAAQIDGWRGIAQAVHEAGGRIFVQLMHTGRIGHPANLPEGAEVLAPSAHAAAGEIWTDAQGMQPHPVPRAMTEADIQTVIQEFVASADHAVAAGLDGIELHAANGYLLEQFLNPHTNTRTDGWGGSIQNRARVLLEIVQQAAARIGSNRIGVRLSPHGIFNDMPPVAEVAQEYAWLASELHKQGIAYLHVLSHEAMGAPSVPEATFAGIRAAFPGTLIRCGGYDVATAQAALDSGAADLIAFGRPFLANPDLVARLEAGTALANPDPNTFYTPGPEGYTTYPPQH